MRTIEHLANDQDSYHDPFAYILKTVVEWATLSCRFPPTKLLNVNNIPFEGGNEGNNFKHISTVRKVCTEEIW